MFSFDMDDDLQENINVQKILDCSFEGVVKIKKNFFENFGDIENINLEKILSNQTVIELIKYFKKTYNIKQNEILLIFENRSNYQLLKNYVITLLCLGKIVIEKDAIEKFMHLVQRLDDISEKGTRNLGKYYDLMFEKIFFAKNPNIDKTDHEFVMKMRHFKVAYEIMYLKFGNIKRISGEIHNYRNENQFDHCIGTMDIILNEFGNPTFYKCIVGLLHDSKEDLGYTDRELTYLFGKDIAKGVEQLTKKDWFLYVSKKDKIFLKKYIRKYIRNSDISKYEKDILKKRFNIKKGYGLENTLKEYRNNPEIILDLGYIINLEKNFRKFFIENFAEEGEKLKNIIKMAKGTRNDLYMKNLQNLDDETVIVKFADRLNNLRTMYGMNKKFVEEKVEETKKYLLPLAEKTCPIAYKLLKSEIIKLS